MFGMIPRLEIKHLTVLTALAETGSVTASAARLGITQSAVSHRIREAERRLGVSLLERGMPGVRLSPAGERLRASSAGFLRELEALERDLEGDDPNAAPWVRLGQATYSRYHWFPDFVEYVSTLDQPLRVDLSGAATTRPFASLNEGLVDVSTVYGQPVAPGKYRWMKLASDPLVAVIAPTHRLADRAFLTARDIAEDRLFSYPLTTEPGFEWEGLIGAPSVPFRRVTSMATPESVIDLVRAGFGVAAFSRWAVQPELSNGTLIEKPLGEDGMVFDWWAVMRARDPEDGPAARLAQAMVDWSRATTAALSTLAFDPRSGDRSVGRQ